MIAVRNFQCRRGLLRRITNEGDSAEYLSPWRSKASNHQMIWIDLLLCATDVGVWEWIVHRVEFAPKGHVLENLLWHWPITVDQKAPNDLLMPDMRSGHSTQRVANRRRWEGVPRRAAVKTSDRCSLMFWMWWILLLYGGGYVVERMSWLRLSSNFSPLESFVF